MESDLYRRVGLQIKRAREEKGISQDDLANAIGSKSPATISHFESGKRKVSIGDLQKISEYFGLPINYFLEYNNPKQEMRRFRLRASGKIWVSAQDDIAEFLSFAHSNGDKLLEPRMDFSGKTPSEVAEVLIESFGIEQPPVSPFEVANRLGIPVFQWDFTSEVSGIFVIDENKVSIGVNRYHPNVRQRFTVAHELGHFVFQENKSLFMDFTDVEMSSLIQDRKDKQLETKANRFAANLLMPKEWIKKDYKRFGEVGLNQMAQKYDVSEQAMWFRLVNLRLVRNN